MMRWVQLFSRHHHLSPELKLLIKGACRKSFQLVVDQYQLPDAKKMSTKFEWRRWRCAFNWNVVKIIIFHKKKIQGVTKSERKIYNIIRGYLNWYYYNPKAHPKRF